jgi:predicted negative regulator of RcsB-dependent stress response
MSLELIWAEMNGFGFKLALLQHSSDNSPLFMDAEITTTTTEESTPTLDTFKLLGWLHANRKRLLIGAIAVAVIGSAIAIMDWKKSQDEINANAALFAVPSLATSPDKVGGASPDALLDVAKDYPATAAAERATVLAAEALFVDGKYAEAEHQFSQFVADHAASPLMSQARVGVAASLEAQGKTSEAIQQYQQVLQLYPSEVSIVSPAKLTLARLCEEQGKFEQSMGYYDDLTKAPNPNDPWFAEAQERKVLLLSKHPELRKMQAAAPSGMAPQPTMMAAPAPAKAPAPAPVAPGSGNNSSAPNLLNIPSGSAKP